MIAKRVNLWFISILGIILLGNSIFITEGSAFTYSNPSTTPLWTYSTGNQYLSAVAISSDGKHIVGASEILISSSSQKPNGTLYLLNNSKSENKKEIWNYNIHNSFNSLAISKDGTYIVGGGGYSERRIHLLNRSSSTPIWTYYTGSWVYDVEISENMYLGAATSGRSYLFLLNDTENSPLSHFSSNGLGLRVAISSNGSSMAISDNEANIYFLESPNLSKVWTYKISGDMSTSLSMSADGNYIVSGGNNLYLFHKSSSTPMWTYETDDHINTVKISDNGEYIVAGSSYSGYEVCLFTRDSSTPVWTFSARDAINSVTISKDGQYIAALSNNYWVYLFNRTTSEPIWRYRLDGYPTASYDYSLDMSSDGKYIIAGGRHKMYLFDKDVVNPPKLIISGYNISYIMLLVGLISVSFIVIIYKNKR